MISCKPLVICIPVVFLLFTGSCRKNADVTIEGTFSSAPGFKVILYQLLPEQMVGIDSTIIDKTGHFELSSNLPEPGFYLLKFDAKRYITLLLEKGEKVVLEGNPDAWNAGYQVSGSPGSEILRQYAEFTGKNLIRLDSLKDVFLQSQSRPDFPEIRIRLDSAYRALYNKQKTEVSAFIQANIKSLASVLIIEQRFGQDPLFSISSDFGLYHSIDSALLSLFSGNSNYIDFHKRVGSEKALRAENEAKAGRIVQGRKAPDFMLTDEYGKQVALSGLKGKYVFVYFWAAWNAPCRKMNLDILPLYHQFRQKGFEIFAVSFDTDRQMWLDACRVDKATWIQVNDPAGLKSEIAHNYGITELMQNVLIDRDGIVLAKNLDAAGLKTLLNSRMEGN